jgi:hypothetical protein
MKKVENFLFQALANIIFKISSLFGSFLPLWAQIRIHAARTQLNPDLNRIGDTDLNEH